MTPPKAVRARTRNQPIKFALLATAVVLLAAAAVPTARAAAPACGGTPHMTDAVGDGHHATTDITGAWIAETPSSLQAVIRVTAGNWASDHDGPVGVVGFALIYSVGSETRYVRVEAKAGVAIGYDHGTWSLGGGFQSAGTTTGSIEAGFPGHATIDIPPLPAGTVLSNLFALTYDEEDGNSASADLHWVDRAPGGTTPIDATFGADFTVGSCIPGALPDGTVVGVSLRAPLKKTGRGRVEVGGKVIPAAAGVPVRIELRGTSTRSTTVTTATDGQFTAKPVIGETTTLRAFAGNVRSGEVTVSMHPRTRISVRKLRGSRVRILGSVSPALPGRVLLVRSGEYRSTAKTRTRRGAFRFTLRRPVKGGYRAVFIPDKGRAERSTSNRGVIK